MHLKNFPSFVLFSYASFRRVWESQISAGLSQKFSGISAREPVPLFFVPQWIEVTFPTREGLVVTLKTKQREIHSIVLVVEGIYSMLWTIHLGPEFKWGAGVGIECRKTQFPC